MTLPQHSDISTRTDELLGVKAPRGPKLVNGTDPETRRLWRKFQQVVALPEKDRRAVIRLVNSLVQARAVRS